MNIDKLFEDKEYLKKEINFFKSKKQIKFIQENKELISSHIKKARHNLRFYKINEKNDKFKDWLIVILYYVLYHCGLALITNKKYSSKNHYATILILIKEYNITKEEVELIDQLSINREDAELYTYLKQDRHDASYKTNTKFSTELIQEYKEKVLDFINKTEELI